jgi:hypothetical protein
MSLKASHVCEGQRQKERGRDYSQGDDFVPLIIVCMKFPFYPYFTMVVFT